MRTRPAPTSCAHARAEWSIARPECLHLRLPSQQHRASRKPSEKLCLATRGGEYLGRRCCNCCWPKANGKTKAPEQSDLSPQRWHVDLGSSGGPGHNGTRERKHKQRLHRAESPNVGPQRYRRKLPKLALWCFHLGAQQTPPFGRTTINAALALSGTGRRPSSIASPPVTPPRPEHPSCSNCSTPANLARRNGRQSTIGRRRSPKDQMNEVCEGLCAGAGQLRWRMSQRRLCGCLACGLVPPPHQPHLHCAGQWAVRVIIVPRPRVAQKTCACWHVR